MVPIAVTRLKSKNYRTFTKPIKLDLPNSGVVFVRSKNTATKTTSGCGKTSLLSMFAYALGFGPSTKEVLTWDTECLFVELEVSLNGEAYTIKRDNEVPGLKIIGPNIKLQGHSAEEWLRNNVGDPKIASAATWRCQRTKGNFFSMVPSKKREFLTKLLGLEVFEEQSTKANSTGEKINISLSSKNSEYRECKSNFDRLLASVPEEPVNIDLEGLRISLGRELHNLDLLTKEQTKTNEELKLLRTNNRNQEEEINTLIAELDSEMLNSHRLLDKALLIQKSNLEKKCGTCGTVLKEAGKIDVDIATPSNKIQELTSIKNDLLKDLRSLREIDVSSLNTVNAKIQNSNRQISAMEQSIARIETCAKDYENSVNKYFAILEDTENRLTNIQTQIIQLELERNREKDYAELIGKDFVSEYLADTLAEISSIANQFLSRIPNSSSCSIVFEPIDKGGKVDIGTKIFVGGVERTGDPLSGGQYSSVELACDLALNVVIRSRKLCQLPWMVLDEPFDGMGTADKEAYIEILGEIGGLFFVVDQSRDFSEMFATYGIGIEFDGVSARLVTETERNNW